MVHIRDKYNPTNQKSLFNSKCVTEIKKFIKELSNKSDDKSYDYKKILFLNGPSGCGKNATISILFKNYNIITVESDDLRLIDNTNEIINDISSYNSSNLAYLDKTVKTTIGNIVLIKNAKHCEKTICQFIDNIYTKYKKNVPFIISCDQQQFRNKFKMNYPITFVDFSAPLHNELFTLTSIINTNEKLRLSNDDIIKVIETSLYDINQLFHILDYIKLNKHSDIDIDNINSLQKDNDIDLHKKIDILFDLSTPFNFSEFDKLTYSDSHVISNTIYQNYTSFMELCDLDKVANVAELFCEPVPLYDISNENDLHLHNITHCVRPIHYIRKYTQDSKSFNYAHLKSVSYSNSNNLDELKLLSLNSSKNINGIDFTERLFFNKSGSSDIWYLINNVIQYIKNINNTLDIKKRNVKVDGYITILKSNNIVCKQVDDIVDMIWDYTLFETNENITKYKFKKEEITIDLRILKKYISVYSFVNYSKLIKASTESVIKYKLIEKILNLQENKLQCKSDEIQSLTYDVSEIWSCMKKDARSDFTKGDLYDF